MIIDLLNAIKHNKSYLAVILLFTIISTIMTYPLILHMSDAMNMGDPMLNSWILAWDAHSLITDPLNLFNANIFYPDTSNTLAYSECMIGNIIIALPVMLLTNNPILVYNLIFILSYILSGFCVFLLVDHYIDDKKAAFLAGIAFAFCAFRTAHYGHLQLLTTQWIPLALLFFDKFLKCPDNKNMVLLWLFSVLQILSSWYLAFYLVITLILYSLFIVVFNKNIRNQLYDKSFIFKVLLLIVSIALVVLPFAIPYIELNQSKGFIRDLGEVSYYSANITDYLQSPWYRLIYNLIYNTSLPLWIPSEHYLAPGLVVLVLSLLAFLRVNKNKVTISGFRECKMIYFYLFLAIVALILSLGTPLHFFSYTINVNLPYYYLYKYVPGFGSMRVPSRVGLLVLLSLSVLSGFGAHKLLACFNDRVKTVCIAVLISAILIESFPSFTYNTIMPIGDDIPDVYVWLADQPGDIGILELPINNIYFNTQYMLYSTYHWKKLVNGYSGFFPPNYWELINLMNSFPSPESIELLKKYNVTYVIVHPGYMNSTDWSNMEIKINNSPDVRLEKVIENDYVYAVMDIDESESEKNEIGNNISFSMLSPAQSQQSITMRNNYHYIGTLLLQSNEDNVVISSPFDNITVIESIDQGDGHIKEIFRKKYFLPLLIGSGTPMQIDIVSPAVVGNYTMYINITYGTDHINVFTQKIVVNDNIIIFNPGESEGAYQVEFWGNMPTQWIGNDTHITIYSDSDHNAILTFQAMSFIEPRTLLIKLDNRVIYQGKIPTEFTNVMIPITLKRGQNNLEFISSNATRPCDIPKLNNSDGRALSIAFQAITINNAE